MSLQRHWEAPPLDPIILPPALPSPSDSEISNNNETNSNANTAHNTNNAPSGDRSCDIVRCTPNGRFLLVVRALLASLAMLALTAARVARVAAQSTPRLRAGSGRSGRGALTPPALAGRLNARPGCRRLPGVTDRGPTHPVGTPVCAASSPAVCLPPQSFPRFFRFCDFSGSARLLLVLDSIRFRSIRFRSIRFRSIGFRRNAGRPSHPRSERRHRASPRSAAAGCTSRRAHCGPEHRS